VRKQLAKGVGILKVAKSLGIGTDTMQRTTNNRSENQSHVTSPGLRQALLVGGLT
jgi:hypothetical protein